MRKTFIYAVLLVLFVIDSEAQNHVRGKIVDKNGIPIPGARVSVKNGPQTTLSEFDGSYSLDVDKASKKIIVDYVGYNSKSAKVSDHNIDITLKKANIWNRIPSKLNWIVSVQSAFPEKFEQPSFGLMVGCVKHFGGYIKAMGGFMPGQTASSADVEMTLKSPLHTITGGFLIRLGSALHLNLGGGYSKRSVTLKTIELKKDGSETRISLLEEYSYSAAALDCGLTLVLGRFNLNAGTILPLGTSHTNFIGNFGFGVNF